LPVVNKREATLFPYFTAANTIYKSAESFYHLPACIVVLLHLGHTQRFIDYFNNSIMSKPTEQDWKSIAKLVDTFISRPDTGEL
jgi:hypothetical protein